MKKSVFFILVIALIVSCSKNVEKLELFSPETFAYSMDSGWELNASVRVKGFDQKESGDKFSASLSYYADLETPDGKLVEKISSGAIDKSAGERMTDLPIEAQIKLDSAYIKGIYKLTFYLKDNTGGRRVKVSSFFELN
jgi:hypothetical protein